MEFTTYLWLAISCYVIGSIPSSVLLSKLLGFADPRSSGSGNIGFSNVMRTSDGKLFPILVLVSDVGKGIISSIIGGIYGCPSWSAAFCLFGNLYALWPHGSGKGVSVLLGVLLYLNWWNILLMPIWFGLTKITYPVIASSMIIAYSGYVFYDLSCYYIFFPLLLLIVWKHKDNFKRLISGNEKKM